MAGTYSKAIASAVCNYFSSKNYKYEFIEEKGILTAGFTISGKLGSYKQYIFFHENNYQVYSVPMTYFLDAEGYAIARASGAIDAATLERGISMIAE